MLYECTDLAPLAQYEEPRTEARKVSLKSRAWQLVTSNEAGIQCSSGGRDYRSMTTGILRRVADRCSELES